MAESILESVSAAYDGLANEAPEAPTTEAPAIATEAPPSPDEPPKPDRARKDDGTFAKQPKDRPTLKLKSPAPEVVSPVAPPGVAAFPVAAQPVAPAVPEKIAAPQEWSGLAKVKWDKLPAAVQQEIVDRESSRMTATQDLMPVKELMDANREFLVNQAGSMPEAMRQMMQFARMSVDNPVALAEHILRSKGIDPRQAFAGQPQAPGQAQAPDIQSYVAQLVQQAVEPFKADAERQQTQQLESTISQFAADPKRPFFNDVRFHMGQLIQAGAAKSLDEAYEQATWANPAIRAHLLEEQRGSKPRAAKAVQVQQAQQARRANPSMASPIERSNPRLERAARIHQPAMQSFRLTDDLSGV